MEIVAKQLSDSSTLCIITNNIHAAFHLYSKKDIELMLPGGRVRHHNGGLVGHEAIEFISRFQADYLIMGIGAISLEGLLLDYDYDEAMLMSQMIKNAQEIILVTDGSKFNKTALAKVGHISEISYLVTDQQPPEKIQQLMAQNNVSLIIPN